MGAARGTIVVDHGDHGASHVLDECRRHGVADVLDGHDLGTRHDRWFAKGEKLLITSENVLDPVLNHLDDPGRLEAIGTLKSKYRCREMLRSLYPDFYFERVALDALGAFALPSEGRFIVKPNRGYFATGIRCVDASSDLKGVRDEIALEVERRSEYFSTSVISDEEVIVEAFVEGEEYAVDMFFTADGEPAIINIYHHPMPENPDYLHALYYTSKPIFDALHGRLVDWFRELNRTLNATSFAIHAEFRLNDRGLVPIELNPLRFGGDGLVDLCYHAFGLNPYEAYFTDTPPDWDRLWAGRDDKIYAWMMGYVGTDIDVRSHRPNMGRFRDMFSNVLSDTVLNYEASPGFAVIYAEETEMDVIHRLVNLDFRDFFLGAATFSEDILRQLYRSGVRVEHPPLTTIWNEGDVEDYVLLIISGSVDVIHCHEAGESHLDTVGANSAVGEFSVIDGRPRSASVRTGAEGCTAMRIAGSAFRGVLRGSPELFEELYWQQLNRIRKMNKRVGELERRLEAIERDRAES